MIKNSKIKRSFHPVMFFIYLSILVIIISGIADSLNLQVTYDRLTTISGEVSTTTVAVNSLLSLDGLKFLLTSAYSNLNEFMPLGMFLIATIAFGIALNSGFIKVLCRNLTSKVPKFVLVFLYALFCVLFSIDSNLGYVILLPIGAVLFMAMNRNPIGGLALGFAMTSAGHGIGLFATSLDYNLQSYTEASARLLDSEYTVSYGSNLIFMIIISIIISAVCTLICEKLLVRMFGRNQIEDDNETMLDEKTEKKGIIGALIATIVIIIPIIIMLIPSSGDGFVGLLLDKSQSNYMQMIYSSDSLFIANIVPIISLIVGVQGFVYGVIAGTIRKIRDMVNFSTDYLKKVGGVFVIIFFASQLVAIVRETNLGTIITASLSNVIAASNFSFIPLVLIIFVFTMISNVFYTGSVAKWSIMAPNIMNVVIKANITPEFAQLIFRAGDSITNMITPLFVYFAIFVGFIEVYTKNKNDISIKECYRAVIPYFLTVMLVWIAMIICWYVIGLPIGVGIYPTV